MKRITALGVGLLAALVVTSAAMAHAKVAPPIVQKGTDNVFTVAVPDREASRRTRPGRAHDAGGFRVDAVMPAAGWKVETRRRARARTRTSPRSPGRAEHPSRAGDELPVRRRHRIGARLRLQRQPDVLRWLGRRLERLGELRHARSGGRGEVVARRRWRHVARRPGSPSSSPRPRSCSASWRSSAGGGGGRDLA